MLPVTTAALPIVEPVTAARRWGGGPGFGEGIDSQVGYESILGRYVCISSDGSIRSRSRGSVCPVQSSNAPASAAASCVVFKALIELLMGARVAGDTSTEVTIVSPVRFAALRRRRRRALLVVPLHCSAGAVTASSTATRLASMGKLALLPSTPATEVTETKSSSTLSAIDVTLR